MKIIGIMTGNSVDGCDMVLTNFIGDKMLDIAYFSQEISKSLQKDILLLKKKLQEKNLPSSKELMNDSFFQDVHARYIKWIAKGVENFLKQQNINKREIDLIGFHGQTLDHNPPSVSKSIDSIYTLQMGSGKMLSSLTGIPVVYDFRSDDIFEQGEGAPLMPPHNEHFAKNLNLTDAIFYNAGNTSNLALIKDGRVVLGFDCGPFNEFSDKLVRLYKKEQFDKDGVYGKQGLLKKDLLEKLFKHSVQSNKNENYLELKPPKSADPSLYHIEDFVHPRNDDEFFDYLYTVEYFSAYTAVYALSHIELDILPHQFVLFGGGWYNPISYQVFKDLLLGDAFVLPEHELLFKKIRNKFLSLPEFIIPDGSKYMEARLMADMAYYFEQQKVWTTPELTGCKKRVVCGVKAEPKKRHLVYDDAVCRAAQNWQN